MDGFAARSDERNIIVNRTFDEIQIGEEASARRTVTREDIDLFAVLTGDVNPVHIDPDFAHTDAFQHVVAHGMLGAGLISRVLGTKLPGPGTFYVSQTLEFRRPVAIGDALEAHVRAIEKDAATCEVVLDCRCINQNGDVVIEGRARVRAPTEKIERPAMELPEIRLRRHERFDALLAGLVGSAPLVTAVAHPCDALSLGAAVEAAQARLIAPILLGPRKKIEKAARDAGLDLSPFRIVDAPHSEAAAAAAVALVRSGEASVLMKGSLHTDELLRAVLARDVGLRTGRRLSHVYVIDAPGYSKPLLLTDAAVNIAPDLSAKRDIVQNAIDLALVIGIERPKAAILSAVETVNPQLRSTLDAAALCKMADRGQITGGIVDGPLAFDNAISLAAAQEKGIVSQVAGQPDILVAPDLEAGNMLAKQLTFLAGADAAGVVLGARAPIVLTSRADGKRTRLASCAVAALMAKARLSSPGVAS